MIVKNRRSSTSRSVPDLDVLRSPHLSGFEPLSGEFGETITVSGYFENMIPGGLSVGQSVVDTFDQPGTTGFTFEIPNNSQSDTLNIATSGGALSSTGVLIVSLSTPTISGFYGGVTPPDAVDYDQVFVLGDSLTISGERLDLVTGVSFSGEQGAVEINAFYDQGYDILTLSLPYINPDSGFFEVKDFKGRTTVSNSEINFNIVSGFTNNLLPGETMTLSGRNVTGMNVLFPSPTGNSEFVSSSNLSNSIDGENVESITVNVPTGISFGNLRITGRRNAIDIEGDVFTPVGVITGVTGFDANLVGETGTYVSLTGINCFDPYLMSRGNTFFSGTRGVLGLSGNGPIGLEESAPTVCPFTMVSYDTGEATIGGVANTFYSKIDTILPTRELSGRLFIVDPWMKYSGALARSYEKDSYYNPSFFWENDPPRGVLTRENYILGKKTSFFSDVYTLSGTPMIFSGFYPSRGIVGHEVQISGEGLNQVTQIEFEPVDPLGLGSVQHSGTSDFAVSPPSDSVAASFLITGTTGVIAYVPEGVSRGPTTLRLIGGLGFATQTGQDRFEVLLSTTTVKYDIIETGNAAPSDDSRSMNYTIEENVGGTVFLVTRTKFPDGTTAVISSVPKP
jgi:hypothetical protein